MTNHQSDFSDHIRTISDRAVRGSLIEVMIALIPTYILLKYGWRAIDVMKRMDLESRTPWYQHTLATVTGLSIIRTFKKENEAIDLFYELEDDNSSAYFLFFNSLRTVFVTIVFFCSKNWKNSWKNREQNANLKKNSPTQNFPTFRFIQLPFPTTSMLIFILPSLLVSLL